MIKIPPRSPGQRAQRFEYTPWLFQRAATAWKKAAQAVRRQVFAKTEHAALGDSVAGSASITGYDDARLTMGARGFVAEHAYVTGAVALGDDCTVNPFATLRGPVRGGNGVRIGAYACLVGFNHGFADPDKSIFTQAHTSRGIVLDDDVGIGAHATIVDGVAVDGHVVIAAGAVVTKDVPDYANVVGNPARVIRLRIEKADTKRTEAGRGAGRVFEGLRGKVESGGRHGRCERARRVKARATLVRCGGGGGNV